VLTFTLTAITVVTSIIVATVIVVIFGYIVVALLERHRRRQRVDTVAQNIDYEYRAAVRAMNDAAGESWRNLTD